MGKSIFLSGCTNLNKYKRAVAEVAEKFGFTTWRDEIHDTGGSPRPVIEEQIKKTDLFFLFLGNKYGTEIQDIGMSSTEDEYIMARDEEKRVFVFVWEVTTREPKQQMFLDRVTQYSNGEWMRTFSTMSELIRIVERILTKFRRTKQETLTKVFLNEHKTVWDATVESITHEYPQYSEFLFLPEKILVPKLDPGELRLTMFFTGREDLLKRVVVGLGAGNSQNLYALNGIGGVGKSELAKHVAMELQESRVFPHGYLWISLEAIKVENIWVNISKLFGIRGLDKIPVVADQRNIFRKILNSVKPLIVLDNGDNPEALQEAYQMLEGQTLLITSRQIASLLGVQNIDVYDLTAEKGADLFWKIYNGRYGVLSEGEKVNKKNAFKQEIITIVKRLAGHPLSIEIIANLAVMMHWDPKEVIEKLESQGIELVDLSSRREFNAYDKQDPEVIRRWRHSGIKRTFGLALKQDFNSHQTTIDLTITLFVTCAALCGEYFYKNEVRKVLEIYVANYDKSTRKSREKGGKIGKENPPSSIMKFLNLGDEKISTDTEADNYLNDIGIPEARALLTDPNGIEKLLDRFVTLRVINKFKKEDDPQNRFSFHALIREYACDILNKHMNLNIWKAVAEWTAYKAIKIQGELGDQLANFVFFLKVFQEQRLYDEYSSILLITSRYHGDQSNWGEAIALLEEGKLLFEKEEITNLDYGHILCLLGDFQYRSGYKEYSKSNIIKARDTFALLKSWEHKCWCDYLLSDILFKNINEESLKYTLSCLRDSLNSQIFSSYGANLHSLRLHINEVQMPAPYSQINRLYMKMKFIRRDTVNLNRLIISCYGKMVMKGELEKAVLLIELVKSISDICTNPENYRDSLYWQILFHCHSGNLNEAKELIIELNRQSLRMGLPFAGKQLDYEAEGWIALSEANYPEAAHCFGEALKISELEGSGNVFICSYILMINILDSKTSVPETVSKLKEYLNSSSSPTDIALGRGVLAAASLLVNNEDEDLKTYREAIKFLATVNPRSSLYLESLNQVLKIELEREKGIIKLIFSPNWQPAFCQPLPTYVRSKKDGKLMKLVMSGICPSFGKDQAQTDFIWLPSYYLDVNPVSNKEFLRFAIDTKLDELPKLIKKGYNNSSPTTHASLDHAKEYCKWSGKLLPNLYEIYRAHLDEIGEPRNKSWSMELTVEEILNETTIYLKNITSQERTRERNSVWEEVDSPKATLFVDKAPWFDGLPEGFDLSPFFGTSVERSKEINQFLELLSGSLNLTFGQKKQLLQDINACDSEKLRGIIHILLEEKQALLQLDPTLNPKLIQLFSFRTRQWQNLICEQAGLKPLHTISLQKNSVYNHQSAFTFAPAFNTWFTFDYSIADSICPSLDAEQKSLTEHFMKLLVSANTELDPLGIVLSMINGEGHSLTLEYHKLCLEEYRVGESEYSLSQNLVALQVSWSRWKSLTPNIQKELKDKIIFYKTKRLLTPFTTVNPFLNPPSWHIGNSDVEQKFCSSIPKFEYQIDLDYTLDLLSNSISLTMQQKERILQEISKHSKEQCAQFLEKLEDEKAKLSNLTLDSLIELKKKHHSAREEWSAWLYTSFPTIAPKSIREPIRQHPRAFLKKHHNPFSFIFQWDSSLRSRISPDTILKYSPNRECNTEYILNLLASSLRLSMTQKKAFIYKFLDISQKDLDLFISELENEVADLMDVDQPLYPGLYGLFLACWSEWEHLLQCMLSERVWAELGPVKQPKSSTILLPMKHDLEVYFERLMQYIPSSQIFDKEHTLILLNILPQLNSYQLEHLLNILTLEVEIYHKLECGYSKSILDKKLIRNMEWTELASNWDAKMGISSSIALLPLIEPLPTLIQTQTQTQIQTQIQNQAQTAENLISDSINPFDCQPTCDGLILDFLDIRYLLPPGVTLEFEQITFLQLLSGSLSLSKDEKSRIISILMHITQEQIDKLIHILQEEKRKFLNLDQTHFKQLHQLCQTHRQAWRDFIFESIPHMLRRMLMEKINIWKPQNTKSLDLKIFAPPGISDINFSQIDFSIMENPPEDRQNNPFASPPNWDAFLVKKNFIHNIIKEHPNNKFSEWHFLQLIMGSISLKRSEKERVIESIPKLDQAQIDGLILIFLEEKTKFIDLEPTHWNQLRELCEVHWSEWIDLIYSRLELDLPSVDETLTSFAYLKSPFLQWTCSWDETEKLNIVCGVRPYTSEHKDKVKFITSADFPAFTGIRGCVPIFSWDDLEKHQLQACEPPGSTC